MPIQEILKSERACCKRIEDLKVKNHQQDCQYFIFKDKPPSINQEEQRQNHRQENADQGQNGKKVHNHYRIHYFGKSTFSVKCEENKSFNP